MLGRTGVVEHPGTSAPFTSPIDVLREMREDRLGGYFLDRLYLRCVVIR
jgi:hypothetical protein